MGVKGEGLGDTALEAATNNNDQGAEVGAGGKGEPVKGNGAEMLADSFRGYISDQQLELFSLVRNEHEQAGIAFVAKAAVGLIR
jgi:hypothetical protein